MRNFKIIALSVSGKGKKIFKARETATEDQFPAGAIQGLIDGKFIEEIKPSAMMNPEKKQKNTTDVEPGEKNTGDNQGPKKEIKK